MRVCLLAIFAFHFAFAVEEVKQVRDLSGFAPQKLSDLPKQIKSEAEIKEILSYKSETSLSCPKYEGFRQAFRGDSNAELVARLAYSETLAANCEEQKLKIAPLIVAAIANRVSKRGDVRSVVFECNQFASSLNVYRESRYKAFLAPEDKELWTAVLKAAQLALPGSSSALKLEPDTVNYFLYKHSPKQKKAPWKYTEDTSHTSPEIQACVRFYKVPGWK